jgi:hypothetical protein
LRTAGSGAQMSTRGWLGGEEWKGLG